MARRSRGYDGPPRPSHFIPSIAQLAAIICLNRIKYHPQQSPAMQDPTIGSFYPSSPRAASRPTHLPTSHPQPTGCHRKLLLQDPSAWLAFAVRNYPGLDEMLPTKIAFALRTSEATAGTAITTAAVMTTRPPGTREALRDGLLHSDHAMALARADGDGLGGSLTTDDAPGVPRTRCGSRLPATPWPASTRSSKSCTSRWPPVSRANWLGRPRFGLMLISGPRTARPLAIYSNE